MWHVKVKAASFFRVSFYYTNATDSTLHMITGKEVQRIEYADGHVYTIQRKKKQHTPTRQEIEWKGRHPRGKKAYTNRAYSNVITLNAPQLVLIKGIYGFAGGLEFERFVDKGGYVSLTLPYYVSANLTNQFGEVGYNEPWKEGRVYYFAPGIRFHATGNKKRADFGLGLHYVCGEIKTTTFVIRYTGMETTNSNNSYLSAMVVNMNLHLHNAGQFVCGFDVTLGYLLEPRGSTDPFFQMGIKLGHRF